MYWGSHMGMQFQILGKPSICECIPIYWGTLPGKQLLSLGLLGFGILDGILISLCLMLGLWLEFGMLMSGGGGGGGRWEEGGVTITTYHN